MVGQNKKFPIAAASECIGLINFGYDNLSRVIKLRILFRNIGTQK